MVKTIMTTDSRNSNEAMGDFHLHVVQAQSNNRALLGWNGVDCINIAQFYFGSQNA